MRYRPAQEVTARVSADGRLTLASGASGAHRTYDTLQTALWIALQQHDGDPMAAADTLADAWDKDIADVGARMTPWLDELITAGFLHAMPD